MRPPPPAVCQITVGRFHHFHLARQLDQRGWLEAIHTGYPRFKLRDESGILPNKIRSFPWLQTPFMALQGRISPLLERELSWWARETLDRRVVRRLGRANVLVALSGCGLRSGREMQMRGGQFVCDRGSSHIRFQDALIREEYRRWGLEFEGVDPRVIAKEEAEYELANRITVPSEFVRRSFLAHGVPEAKLAKIPYGARLDRFHPVDAPDPQKFTVLFVGQVTLRKGFLYLLDAFAKVKHPHKELLVIGAVAPELRPLLKKHSLEHVTFLGRVPNTELPGHYSRAHVFAFPSIEDGFGMVMGEAMACGCPVVATKNSGAEDLFTDGVDGYIVEVGSANAILNRLEILVQDPVLRLRLAESSLRKVRHLGGWDAYGSQMAAVFADLCGSTPLMLQ